MTVYEVLTIAVIGVLGLGATVAIFLGLLNWVGGFHVVHCRACRHLTTSEVNAPQSSCAHCRHPMLMHPIYAVGHPNDRVRVRADTLRY